MANGDVYLKANVLLEPLVNRWHAWAQMFAPATAAFHQVNAHLKIMQSYVSAPQTHVAALRNPAMAGGPFIDYGGKRVEEIRKLMEKTRVDQAVMTAFVQDVKDLNQLLLQEATGQSLEPLYNRIPDSLRGMVELFYDLSHRPSFRLIERLVYESPLYDPSLQSLSLSLIHGDDRKFAFSTPKLAEPGSLDLDMPFDHEAIDRLFSMRFRPGNAMEIGERLGLSSEQRERFGELLTEEAPAPAQRYEAEGIRFRYLGHACVLIETRELALLTDPIIGYRVPSEMPRYTHMDLPPVIDYVLITHSHADHFLFESLLQLRHKIRHVVVPRNGGALEDPSLKLILQKSGFRNVIELDELESLEVEGGAIRSLPFLGEHADLNIRSKNGFLVSLNGRQAVFAADSNNLEPRMYELLHAMTGDLDLLFLGMECEGAPLSWIYGPLLLKPVDRKMDQSRRLSGSDFERGIRLVETMGCKQVLVYAMGQEPWLRYLTSLEYHAASRQLTESDRLVEACRQRGIPAERLYGCGERFLTTT